MIPWTNPGFEVVRYPLPAPFFSYADVADAFVLKERRKARHDDVVLAAPEVNTDTGHEDRTLEKDGIPIPIDIDIGNEQVAAADDDCVLTHHFGLVVLPCLGGRVQDGELVSGERPSE
jgi:hypothetical protein